MITPCCPQCGFQLNINQAKYPTPKDVMEVIGTVMEVPYEELVYDANRRTHIELRQVYCYLATKHCVLYKDEPIGNLINRDKATVHYSVSVVKNRIDTNDRRILAIINRVEHEMSNVFALCV